MHCPRALVVAIALGATLCAVLGAGSDEPFVTALGAAEEVARSQPDETGLSRGLRSEQPTAPRRKRRPSRIPYTLAENEREYRWASSSFRGSAAIRERCKQVLLDERRSLRKTVRNPSVTRELTVRYDECLAALRLLGDVQRRLPAIGHP